MPTPTSVVLIKFVSDGSAMVVGDTNNGTIRTVTFDQTTGAFGTTIGTSLSGVYGQFSITKDEKYLITTNGTTALRAYNFDKTTGIGGLAGTFTVSTSAITGGIDAYQP